MNCYKFKVVSIIFVFIILMAYSSRIPLSFASLSVDTDKDTYYLGETVTVTVTGATPNGHVNLQVNDPSGAPAYVDEKIAPSTGIATFKFKIPSTWSTGKYTVIVVDSSTKTSASTTFNVEKAPPPPPPPGVGKVTISADKTEVEMGGSVTFLVSVFDTNGNPMGGQSVYLYINDRLYASKPTSSTGKVIFKVAFDVPGYYDVYAKSDNVKSGSITIYVYKPPPKVSNVLLSVNATEITAGDAVLLTATVYDQYGDLMANVNVELYINGSLYASSVTSSDGKTTFTVTLDKEGTYEFYAIADTVRSNSVFVVVSPPPPPKPEITILDINVDKLKVQVGESVKVSVLVLDQFNEPMADVMVKLYVNGNLYALNKTNANGKAFFRVTFTEDGEYVIYAEAEGVRSAEVTVTVTPAPPPPPPITQYLIYIALIVIIVIIIFAVMYYMRRER